MPRAQQSGLLLLGALLLALAGQAPAVPLSGQLDSSLRAPVPFDVPPVNVTLFAEALCPYCAGFITDTLDPLMKSGFDGIIQFSYVAYGNAKRTKDGELQCQHGPAECRLNRVINCAAHIYPGQYVWLPFVTCLERAPRGEREEWVDKCAQQQDLDPFVLHHCADGAMGEALERDAEARTAALRPAHTYVPWVLVQGIPLGQDDANLKKYLCVAYNSDLPEACFDHPDAPSLASAAPKGRLVHTPA